MSRPKRKTHNEYKLAEAIIALSAADNWDEARREWRLAEIWRSDEPGQCLCGHTPIMERCLIENIPNGSEAIIGNVCIQKFLGIDAAALTKGLDRLGRDPSKAIPPKMIDFLTDHKLISRWEETFLRATARKRRLSQRQLNKRTEINRQILELVAYDAEREV